MGYSPNFTAEIYYLTTEEGGRMGYAASGYRPNIQFDHISYFRGCGIQKFTEVDKVFPGESVIAEVTLLTDISGINIGNTFNVYDGSRLVAHGVVIEK